MARHGVLSVAMIDRIIGRPHQEGIDYQGRWCHGLTFSRRSPRGAARTQIGGRRSRPSDEDA